MGRRFDEETVFAVARAFERQIAFPDEIPPGVKSL
jgi:Asp-tRNA(Asn)/Glu-tRNA(Gln) amidotransferase A subunit family amidase